MLDAETIKHLSTLALEEGLEPGALLAVAEVESGGRVFARIGGRDEPLIRFEGHYFDRRLTGAERERARRAGLSSPRAGGVANPASQAARWRLLLAAADIDRAAAYESTSWGIGQVMGAHWAWLGYGSIDALVADARRGAAGQARLMTRFIRKSGLADALRRRDWDAFARGYNGPAYRANGYHKKMAQAYERYRHAVLQQPSAVNASVPGSNPRTSLFGWLKAAFIAAGRKAGDAS